jgi:hypothetical protein
MTCLLRGAAAMMSISALLLAGAAQEKQQAAAQVIEALIVHVEQLKGAKFVRNDVAYDAKTAAQFLRGKWKSNTAQVKTAADFIDKIATASSTTGKAYTIRFQDGKEVQSGAYLHAELRKLEKSQ